MSNPLSISLIELTTALKKDLRTHHFAYGYLKNDYVPIEVLWSDVPGRDQKWKDVAWAYHIADEVEKISGKDSCSKERYKNQEAIFAVDDSKEKIDELETLALETGSAAANIEEQYVDMMDALATENPTEGDEEESKPEKTVDDSHEEEDLDDRISVDLDSATELLEGEIEENTESPEENVEKETDSSKPSRYSKCS